MIPAANFTAASAAFTTKPNLNRSNPGEPALVIQERIPGSVGVPLRLQDGARDRSVLSSRRRRSKNPFTPETARCTTNFLLSCPTFSPTRAMKGYPPRGSESIVAGFS